MEDYDDDFDSPTVKKGKVTATKTATVNNMTQITIVLYFLNKNTKTSAR